MQNVTKFACSLARHRRSNTLEVKDVRLHLEKNWNMRIPGFASDDVRLPKKPTMNEAHKMRVLAVKKNEAAALADAKAGKRTRR